MRTIPAILADYARGGDGKYVYFLDIEPYGVDSWTTKRFSQNAIEVTGNSYTEGLISSISRISTQARIVDRGGVATLPDLDVSVIDKALLHNSIVADDISNRKATVYLTAISSNRCLNSSFEKRSGDNFNDWTEVPSPSGGSVTAVTSEYYDVATCCQIASTNITEGSYISQSAIPWRMGERILISLYAKTSSGTATVKIAIKEEQGAAYYTGEGAATPFQFSRYFITLGTATTSWQRFSVPVSYVDWLRSVTGASSFKDKSITIEIWTAPNETFRVDAVQIESMAHSSDPTTYHHNRYELTSNDVLTMFTGIVRRPKWKTGTISFQLEAWSIASHKEIPVAVVTEDDSADWVVPKDAVGCPYPMTYGDFTSGGERPWNQTAAALQPMARGLLANTNADASTGVVVVFDRVALYHPAGTYRLFSYDEDADWYDEQMCYDHGSYSYDDVEMNDDLSSNARFKQSSNPQFLPQGKMPLMQALRARQMVDNHQFTDYAKVRDGNLGTYAYSSHDDPRCGAHLASIRVFSDELMIDDNLVSPHYCIFALCDAEVTDIVDGDTSFTLNYISINGWKEWSVATLTLWDSETGDYAWRNVPAKRSASANKLLCQLQASPTTENALPTGIRANFYADCVGALNHVIKVYEVGLLVYYTRIFEDIQFAAQLYGRTFGGTWNGRKTAANIVDSAPEVLESIIRTELGGGDNSIDMAAFDAADTARSVSAAGQLHGRTKSINVFDEICKEFGLLYFVNLYGKHSCLALKYNSAVKNINVRDFIDPYKTLQISTTPRESIVNSVNLRYDVNQYSGEYAQLAYCNRNGYSGSIGASYQTKCSNSYDALGQIEQALEMECDWIKSTATAEAIVKWLIDWNYLERYIIEGSLTMDWLGLEIGDTVTLNIPPFLPESMTLTSRFIVMDIRVQADKRCIDVQLLEVKG
jgi:hypothetical protein